MIGRKVSKEEADKRWSSNEKGVINWKERLIIEPSELYTPDKPTTLNWEVLAGLERKSGVNGDILLPGYCNDFIFFLGELIDNAPKERFSKQIEPGCWITYGHYTGGIEVYKERTSDHHGRGEWVPEARYPMKREDIEGYVKYFLNRCGAVYAAQIASVPNMPWWDKKVSEDNKK